VTEKTKIANIKELAANVIIMEIVKMNISAITVVNIEIYREVKRK
jgi:hypothetical protein